MTTIHQPIAAPDEATPRGGLLSTLGLGVVVLSDRAQGQGSGDDPLDPGGRWKLGYNLEGRGCHQAHTSNPEVGADCDEIGGHTEIDDSDFDPMYAHQTGRAFKIWGGVKCSTFPSGDRLADFQREADQRLALRRWNAIARELWTGEQAIDNGWDNRRLASTDANVLHEDGLPVVEAIGTIEDAMSTCTASPVRLLHMPRKLIPFLAFYHQLVSSPSSDRIFTWNGSQVIADDAYPGTAPDGSDPGAGVAWIYGTSVMAARLSTIYHPTPDNAAAVHPQTNEYHVRTEQLAAISWLCCHYAIAVQYGS